MTSAAAAPSADCHPYMFYVAAQVSSSFSLRSNTFHSFVRFFQIHCKTDLPLLAIYTTVASLFWFLQTLSSGGLIQKNEPNLNTRSIIPRISKRIFSFASCSSPAPLDSSKRKTSSSRPTHSLRNGG
jgi:hypothetical protein